MDLGWILDGSPPRLSATDLAQGNQGSKRKGAMPGAMARIKEHWLKVTSFVQALGKLNNKVIALPEQMLGDGLKSRPLGQVPRKYSQDLAKAKKVLG